MEVGEREEQLTALTGSDGPVALRVGVVGQRVVGGGKPPSGRGQHPPTA